MWCFTTGFIINSTLNQVLWVMCYKTVAYLNFWIYSLIIGILLKFFQVIWNKISGNEDDAVSAEADPQL